MHDFKPAEEAIIRFISENGAETITSAYLKLELGMATSEEQMMMAGFIQRMRDMMKGMVDDDEV